MLQQPSDPATLLLALHRVQIKAQKMMPTRAVMMRGSVAVMSHSQLVLRVLRSSVQGNARQPSERYVVISMLTVSYKLNMLLPLCNAILCRSMSSIYR
jgi:hypothetical protein